MRVPGNSLDSPLIFCEIRIEGQGYRYLGSRQISQAPQRKIKEWADWGRNQGLSKEYVAISQSVRHSSQTGGRDSDEVLVVVGLNGKGLSKEEEKRLLNWLEDKLDEARDIAKKKVDWEQERIVAYHQQLDSWQTELANEYSRSITPIYIDSKPVQQSPASPLRKYPGTRKWLPAYFAVGLIVFVSILGGTYMDSDESSQDSSSLFSVKTNGYSKEKSYRDVIEKEFNMEWEPWIDMLRLADMAGDIDEASSPSQQEQHLAIYLKNEKALHVKDGTVKIDIRAFLNKQEREELASIVFTQVSDWPSVIAWREYLVNFFKQSINAENNLRDKCGGLGRKLEGSEDFKFGHFGVTANKTLADKGVRVSSVMGDQKPNNLPFIQENDVIMLKVFHKEAESLSKNLNPENERQALRNSQEDECEIRKRPKVCNCTTQNWISIKKEYSQLHDAFLLVKKELGTPVVQE